MGPIEVANNTRLDTTICNGQMPLQVFMFGLKSTGALGSATNNPFLFESCNVTAAQCEFEGNRIPAVPYQPIFDGASGPKYKVAHEYMEFMKSLGVTKDSNLGPPINMEEFASSFVVFSFPFANDLISDSYTQEVPQGKTSIHLELGTGSPISYRFYFMCLFQSHIQIDQERNVKLSYIPGSAGEEKTT